MTQVASVFPEVILKRECMHRWDFAVLEEWVNSIPDTQDEGDTEDAALNNDLFTLFG